MPCQTPLNDPASDPIRCKCQNAVLRAYRELVKNLPEGNAMEAACLVYGYHHPEDSPEECTLIVERWVHAENLH